VILSARAHAASVPVAVHLDHATDAAHLELAIGLAEKEGIKFDSIMVDASHADVGCLTLYDPQYTYTMIITRHCHLYHPPPRYAF
jgi:fructose/tagatose bisphosphate aldolase